MADTIASHEVRAGADSRVRYVLELIHTRYADPHFTLATIAADVNLSVWHLCRLLKENSGLSFGKHLNTARVEAARHLLSVSALSIKEIAATVGYRRTSDLDRHFKQLYGLTPKKYSLITTHQRVGTDRKKAVHIPVDKSAGDAYINSRCHRSDAAPSTEPASRRRGIAEE
jgi:transcriptional regulator GlxA family with amidase domain